MNEYIPNGYLNMTEYNRVNKTWEKAKYVAQGIIGLMMLAGAIIVDSLI